MLLKTHPEPMIRRGDHVRILTRQCVALNTIVSVTYYLKLHNAISIYCVACIFSTNVKLVQFGHNKTTTLLGEKLHQRFKNK